MQLRVLATAVLVAIAALATLMLAAAYLAAPRLHSDLNPTEILAGEGALYIAPLHLRVPPGYVVRGDDLGNSSSDLQILENGVSLGPAHALHADIRERGGGRYSHWQDAAWFSASDSSDPRRNGRGYSVSVTATVHPLALPVVAFLDLIALIAARRWVVAALRFRRAMANAALIAAVVVAACVAAGLFGRINASAGASKDVDLVVATLMHALLGCAILVGQWVAGAGLASLVLRGRRATLPDLLLLGFVLSLPLVAVLGVTALVLPHGFGLACAIWLACCVPLLFSDPQPGERAALLRAALGVLPFALLFGCWMGLHWHGPTATLAGSPTGDLVYYSTSIVSLSKQLYPYLNLGYEPEPFNSYFNMLFPLLGAALSGVLPIEPFLYITASGASFFVLCLGVALHLYIRGTGILRSAAHSGLLLLTLSLAIIVANRYPYWIIESIPMIYSGGLILAVVYWARKKEMYAQFLAFLLAIAGSAFSKVVGAGVLAPFVAAAVAQRFVHMSKLTRIVALALASSGAAYAAVLVYRLGSINFAMAPLGPSSLDLVWHYGASVSIALPFMLRDIAAVLLAGIAFLIADWMIAGAIAFGFALFLFYPYLFQFDFVCAVLILAFIACDDLERLWRYRWLTLTGLLLALPAAILTDPAGIASGGAWLACIGGVILVVFAGAGALAGSWAGKTAAATAAVLCLGLVAVARGELILDSGWRQGEAELTPEVREIWLVVRERTPRDALVFTDQTAIEPRLLGGWNTYAFMGARQIFVSNLYMNAATRVNRPRALDALAKNEAVLSGDVSPTQLTLREHYSAYFAVVSRTRHVPAGWIRLFENGRYSLYRIEPAG